MNPAIAKFFLSLGAPLKNIRWSWGAIHPVDGAVFLRVWQDRKFVENRVMFMMVTHNEMYQGIDDNNLGYCERREHIAAISVGAPCYMVMCLAVDPSASPRQIKSFNSVDLFVGGGIVERDGDSYIQVKERIPVLKVLHRSA